MIISIQGQKGSFHHIAADRVSDSYELIERDSFREIFDDIANQRANIGIVAIENSIAGSLSYNYDLLSEYKLPIVGEIFLRISHQLMTLPGTTIEQLDQVWSHPMAIEQCRVFLRKYPHIKIVEKEDTAGSARIIAEENRRDTAAIAGKLAAELYGLEILAENIETDPNNYTRFLLFGDNGVQDLSSGKEFRTSLYVGISHKSGSLVDFLNTLRDHEINMSKIESRPRTGEPWHYDFYLDVIGSVTPETHPRLFKELENKSTFLHILGAYPIIYSEFHS